MAASSAPPPIPQALVDTYAKYAKVSPDQARQILEQQQQQALSGNQWNPFGLPDNAETGTLYIGTTPAGTRPSPFVMPSVHMPFGEQREGGIMVPFKIPSTDHTKQIHIHNINLPTGYTAEFVADTRAFEKGSALSGQTGMFNTPVTLVIKDRNKKVVYQQLMTNDQKAQMWGFAGLDQQSLEAGPIGADRVELAFNPEQLQAGTVQHFGAKDQKNTIENEMRGLYSIDPATMRNYKHELWTAGYYGSKKLDEVNMDVLTGDDFSAFASLMMTAAQHYAAGDKVTWQDLLSQQARTSTAAAASKAKTYRLTDPATITEQANAIATKLVGHGPSPQDVQNVLKMVEQGEQSRKAADEAGGGFYQATDPTAEIMQYFRQKYPNDAKATDYADRAKQWEDLLAQSPAPKQQIVTFPNG